MSKCAAIEPAPTRFYAPVGLFSASELSQIGAEWLGEFITSPGVWSKVVGCRVKLLLGKLGG